MTVTRESKHGVFTGANHPGKSFNVTRSINWREILPDKAEQWATERPTGCGNRLLRRCRKPRGSRTLSGWRMSTLHPDGNLLHSGWTNLTRYTITSLCFLALKSWAKIICMKWILHSNILYEYQVSSTPKSTHTDAWLLLAILTASSLHSVFIIHRKTSLVLKVGAMVTHPQQLNYKGFPLQEFFF